MASLEGNANAYWWDSKQHANCARSCQHEYGENFEVMKLLVLAHELYEAICRCAHVGHGQLDDPVPSSDCVNLKLRAEQKQNHNVLYTIYNVITNQKICVNILMSHALQSMIL